MQQSSGDKGDLHGRSRTRRGIAGFIVTEGSYPPGARLPRHDHENASVSIVLAGGYEETFGRRTRRGEPGVVIVHPEGEHHQEVHDPVRTILLTLEIDGQRRRGLGAAAGGLSQAWHRTDFALVAIAHRLCREIERSDAASDLVIESLVLEVLDALSHRRLPATHSSPWLEPVLERLETPAAVTPTMDELSEIAGVHPVHLARAFRRRFGCSVGAYRRRQQIGRAALMLRRQEESLAQIAYAAGFADQSHMTRLVRAHTGLTPGAWRRRDLSTAPST